MIAPRLYAITPFKLTNLASFATNIHLPHFASRMLYLNEIFRDQLSLSLQYTNFHSAFRIVQSDGSITHPTTNASDRQTLIDADYAEVVRAYKGEGRYWIPDSRYPLHWLENLISLARTPLFGVAMVYGLIRKFQNVMQLYTTLSALQSPEFEDLLDFLPTPPHQLGDVEDLPMEFMPTPPHGMDPIHFLNTPSRRLIDAWHWQVEDVDSHPRFVRVDYRDGVEFDIGARIPDRNDVKWLFSEEDANALQPPPRYTNDGEQMYDLACRPLACYRTSAGFEHTTHHFRLLYIYIRRWPAASDTIFDIPSAFTEGTHAHALYGRAGLTNFYLHPRYAMLRFSDLDIRPYTLDPQFASAGMAHVLMHKAVTPCIYTESLFAWHRLTKQRILIDNKNEEDEDNSRWYYYHLRSKTASQALIAFKDTRPIPKEDANKASNFEPMFGSKWSSMQGSTTKVGKILYWGRRLRSKGQRNAQEKAGNSGDRKYSDANLPISLSHVDTTIIPRGGTAKSFLAVTLLSTVAYHLEFYQDANAGLRVHIAFQPETIGYMPHLTHADGNIYLDIGRSLRIPGSLRYLTAHFGSHAQIFLQELAETIHTQNKKDSKNKKRMHRVQELKEGIAKIAARQQTGSLQQLFAFSTLPTKPTRTISPATDNPFIYTQTWDDGKTLCIAVCIAGDEIHDKLRQSSIADINNFHNARADFEKNHTYYEAKSGNLDYGEGHFNIYDFWPALELPVEIVESCFMTRAQADSRDDFERVDGNVFYKTYFAHNVAAYVRQVHEDSWFKVCFLKRIAPLDPSDGFEERYEEQVQHDTHVPVGIVDRRPAAIAPHSQTTVLPLVNISPHKPDPTYVSMETAILTMYLSLDITPNAAPFGESLNAIIPPDITPPPADLYEWYTKHEKDNSETTLRERPPLFLRQYAQEVHFPTNVNLAYIPLDKEEYIQRYTKIAPTHLNRIFHYDTPDSITLVEHMIYILHNTTADVHGNVFTRDMNSILHEALFIESMTSVPKPFHTLVAGTSTFRDVLVGGVLSFKQRTGLADGIVAVLNRAVHVNELVRLHETWERFSANSALNAILERVLSNWHNWNQIQLFRWIELAKLLKTSANQSKTEEDWLKSFAFGGYQLGLPDDLSINSYAYTIYYLVTGQRNENPQNLFHFQIRVPYGTSIYVSFYRNELPFAVYISLSALMRSIEDARKFRATALWRILKIAQ